MTYERTFQKGQTLDESLNNFIVDALQETTAMKNVGLYPHDVEFQFTSDVNITITIEKA